MINDILENPYTSKSVEFNDIIIPKLAGQLGKCYVTNISIALTDIDYIYLNEKLNNIDVYSNIAIVLKAIKEYILKEKSDIKEIKKQIKKKGIIDLNLRSI